MNANHRHHGVTVVSGGSTELYAIQLCVHTDADPSPTSSGFECLEETLASGRGC